MNRKRRTARGGEVKKGEGEGVYEVKRKREGREERSGLSMYVLAARRRGSAYSTEAYKEARKNRK